MTAAEALGRIGDRRAADPLTTLLQDASPDVRSAAANTLTTITEKEYSI